MRDGRSGIPPSEGERRALVGFSPQYRLAALLALRALERGLEAVRLLDPGAGRVDDMQLYRPNRVDAYQVKWEQYPGAVTFNYLVTAQGGTPNLVAQLADGWQKLRDSHPTRRIVVHLLTNSSASVSDTLVQAEPKPSPNHLAAFIEQAWKPKKRGQAVSASWREAWDRLREASGLQADMFEEFVQDCEFDLHFALPDEDAQLEETPLLTAQTATLAQALLGRASAPDRRTTVSRDELLDMLGLRGAYRFAATHNFPLRELYEPVAANVTALDQALENHDRGYLAILGGPGIGKSTFTAHFLQRRPERVVRYYAYVPDAQDPSSQRGESATFLHDLVLALEEQGFRAGGGALTFDRRDLLDRFYRQLAALHDEYRRTGRRTLLLVDGLDHIAREQRPERSLLLDLPVPGELPEGVVVLLGSQTDQLDDLRPAVHQEIQDPGRRIQMQPLNREATMKLIQRAPVAAALSSSQQERLMALSAGHPLALSYLINRLSQTTAAEEIERVLDETVPYRGDIEALYRRYWQRIEPDLAQAHLLGLLVRLRRVVDLDWVSTWAARDVLRRTVQQSGHYFNRESDSRWTVFHNSFRLFLLQQTATTPYGRFSEAEDQRLHTELADRCRDASDPYWQWEEVYHRAQAGLSDAVLSLIGAERAREQFFAFRPPDAIQADLNLAVQAAVTRRDLVRLAHSLLASTELTSRTWQLEVGEVDLVALLCALGLPQVGAEYVRDGNRLRMDVKGALKACVELYNVGLRDEAQRILDLAEPVDVLTATRALPAHQSRQDLEPLEYWAEAAALLRSADEVIRKIRLVRTERNPHRNDVASASRKVQARLLFRAGLSFLEHSAWSELERVTKELDPAYPEDVPYWYWLHAHTWQRRWDGGDRDGARALLEHVLTINLRALGSLATLHLAESILRLLDDAERARQVFASVPLPTVDAVDGGSEAAAEVYSAHFRYYRLMYTLGEERPPEAFRLVPARDGQEGIVIFEQALCHLGWVEAAACRAVPVSGAQLLDRLRPFFGLFDVVRRRRPEWISSYTVERNENLFYTLVVGAARRHGPDALTEVQHAFERMWNDPNLEPAWRAAVRRHITLELFKAGAPKRWAVAQLRAVEEVMEREFEMFEVVGERIEQAWAWTAVEALDDAKRLLRQALTGTFRVAQRKDYQFSSWLSWLALINDLDPEGAAARSHWFARASVALDALSETGAGWRATHGLLQVAFSWSPPRALDLYNWLYEREKVSLPRTICGFLTATLDAPNPPLNLVREVLSGFMLSIATEAEVELVDGLVRGYVRTHGREAAREMARTVLLDVRRYAYPDARYRWQQGVLRALLKENISVEGLAQRYEAPPGPTYGGETFELREGGGELPLEDVLGRIDDLDDLRAWLGKATSYFDWRPVIERLQNRLPERDLPALANLLREALPADNRLAALFVCLSERLTALGKTDQAWALGEEALAMTEAAEWVRDYLGTGVKLDAVGVLKRLDTPAATKLAYKMFEEDMKGAFYRSHSLSQHLDEIIPLLSEDPPLLESWREVEDYVRALFAGAPMPQEGPDAVLQEAEHWDPALALAEFLVSHLNHPTNLVAEAAQRTCLRLLKSRDEAVLRAIRLAFERHEDFHDKLALLLDALAESDIGHLEPFAEEIAALHSSPSVEVRRIGWRLSERLGFAFDVEVTRDKRLPLIYTMDVPPLPDIDFSEADAEVREILRDPRDPRWDLLSYAADLELVARVAGLNPANVFHRAQQLMHSLVPEGQWSRQGEAQLRAQLRSADLAFPYMRPRAVVARRSLYHLVAELFDAKVLDFAGLRRLSRVLRCYDPEMALKEPAPRPAFISTTVLSESRGSRRQLEVSWLAETEGAFDASRHAVEGGFVFAQDTVLQLPGLACFRERRRAVISGPGEALEVDEAALPVGDFSRGLVADYREMAEGEPSPLSEGEALVVQQTFRWFDTPGATWLALNPTVGVALGWHLVDEGVFRWLDGEGELMAESLWWRDGEVGHSQSIAYQPVGEGWLVLVTSGGWERLRKSGWVAARWLQVTREQNVEGEVRSQVAFQKKPLDDKTELAP